MTTTPDIPHLIELAETGSTNDDAKAEARKGCPEGTVIWAHQQTAGRGRQGNHWLTLGGNLFATVVLRPRQATPAEAGQLSFVAAVALAETLRGFLPDPSALALKWPNDVLIGGRKAAGILLETEASPAVGIDWVVIGMGVNIVNAPDGAVSLADYDVATTSAAVLEKLYKNLMSFYDLWKRQGFGPIRDLWLERAGHLGRVINVRLPREQFQATFVGIDAQGSLQVEMADGSRRDIASGEVYAS